MSEHYPEFDVVDFARQIIKMDRYISELERENEHYKKLHKDNCEALNRSSNHTKEMIAMCLSATLDPDSSINRGDRAIVELKQIREQPND
jgi:hypothetical protein